MSRHWVEWIDHGRTAQCAPNPAFPHGKAVDIALPEAIACVVALPYPAPRCGIHVVVCPVCGARIGVTAAGRPDDPVSVRIPCLVVGQS